MPPADGNGEYRWIPSEAFTSLKNAIDTLKKSYVGADALGNQLTNQLYSILSLRCGNVMVCLIDRLINDRLVPIPP